MNNDYRPKNSTNISWCQFVKSCHPSAQFRPNKPCPLPRKLSADLYRRTYLIIVFSLACCLAPAYGQTATQLIDDTVDEWTMVSFQDAGVKAAPIAELIGAIRREDYKNIHSVLLARGGRLILEEYFHGYDRDKPHQIRSATKSIGSVLVGIAIDRGYLPGVEEPIFQYFKDKDGELDDRTKDVTIKSLLTMTSGFDCDDHSGESFQCERAMYKAENWVNFALNLPMAHRPGEHWAYNSTSLILLSDIIAQASGLSVRRFADKYLIEPLGITDIQWGFSPKGHVWLGGNASMRPRDMAKFGQMCLDKGSWQNKQIVSEAWLSESTGLHAYSNYGMGYGYLWWRGRQSIKGRSIEGFWAQGNGGQAVFICPNVDLVAVFTGGNYNSILELQFMGMLTNYILPAMLPPIPEKRFINLEKQVMAALSGSYRCDKLHLDLFVEEDGLVSQLVGQKARLFFETNDRFFIPNPIFGDMNGRIVMNEHGKPKGLLINGAFSEFLFSKID